MTIRASDQPVTLVDSVSGQTVTTSIAELDELAFAMSEQNILSNTSPSMLSKSYEAVENSLSVAAEWTGDLLSDGVEGATGLAKSAGSAIGEAYSGSALEYGVNSTRELGSELATEVEAGVVEKIQQAKVELQEWKDDPKAKLEQTAEEAQQSIESAGESIGEGLSRTKDGAVHHYNELFGNKGIDFGNLSNDASEDRKIGKPLCLCQSIEPCCVVSGEIKDADRDKVAGERKIEWPLCPGQPSKLLMIMKDVKGSHLGADIEVMVAGKNNSNCTNKYDYHPSVLESSGLGGEEHLIEQKSERTVYFDKPDLGLFLSSTLFPAEVIGCFIVLKKVVEYVHGDHLKNGYSYKVIQCSQDETMGRTLQVIPLPYIKLAGNLTIEVEMSLTTEGVKISPLNEWFSGSLEAQYGDVEFSSTVTKKAVGRDQETKLPFPLYVVEKIKQIFDFLSSKSGVSGETINKIKQAGADVAEGTGVTVTPKIQFTAEGVETKKVMGSPNVKLDLAALKMTFGGEIKGQIDILEIAVTLLSGGAAKVLKKAKEKAERIGDGLNSSLGGENTKLNCELVAMLEFGGSFDLIIDYGSAGEVILQWDGKKIISGSEYEKEIKQEIKFFASATISFVVEAEVILLEAEAGINGVLNTAWNFQFKQKEEDGVVNEYKRYFFEGLKLKGGIYYGVSMKTNNKRSESDNKYEETERETSQALVEKEYDLLEPTVKEVTDDIPAWIKTS